MRATSALAALLVAGAAVAQEERQGRLLYEASCGGCHYERIHKRPPERTKVKSLADLRDMVALWAPHASRPLALDDREAIVQYLDRSRYKLGNQASGRPERTAPAPEYIYGAELMNAKEREQYRKDMQASPAEQERIRARHRERIRERARQRGVELDAQGVVR